MTLKNYTHYSVLIIFAISFLSGIALAGERWEVWPKLDAATALIGDTSVGVYSDPKFKNDVILFPGCWLIRLDTKKVFEANCPFKIENDNLLFDSTWRSESGRLSGVAWDDPKGNVSFFSSMFRKPKFMEASVKFWSGDEWVVVKNLPVHKKSTE